MTSEAALSTDALWASHAIPNRSSPVALDPLTCLINPI